MNQATTEQPTVIGFGARLSLVSRDTLAFAYKMPASASTDNADWKDAIMSKYLEVTMTNCGPRGSVVNRQLRAERFFSSPTLREARVQTFDHGVRGAVINGIETDGYKLSHYFPQLLGTTGHEPIAAQDPPITDAEAFQTILENTQPSTLTE